MKILLVQPNASETIVGFGSMAQTEPLALEIIAASVPEHEVKILDLRFDPSLDSTISSFGPRLVGVSGYTPDVPMMLDICQRVKSQDRDIMTVVGGYHATLCPQDFDRDFVDAIVMGEGETTFRELADAVERGRDLGEIEGIAYRESGKQVTNPQREMATSLNSLPLPSRHLVDHYREQYHLHFWESPYSIETSRGCPYRCYFCAVWRFHRGKCRFRSPELALEDVRRARSRNILFVDDNFLQDVRRAERMYELIRAEGMENEYWIQARSDSIVKRPDLIEKWASIGLKTVLIGLEKASDEELTSIDKRTSVKTNERAMEIMRENGVDIWGAFIVDPQWTRSDFDALIDYVLRMEITIPQFTVLTPIPGTAFFQEKHEEITTHNYQVFDFLHSVLPTKLPIEEFYSNMARLYSSTTMGWRELMRRVRSGEISPQSLKRLKEILGELTNPQAYLRDSQIAWEHPHG